MPPVLLSDAWNILIVVSHKYLYKPFNLITFHPFPMHFMTLTVMHLGNSELFLLSSSFLYLLCHFALFTATKLRQLRKVTSLFVNTLECLAIHYRSPPRTTPPLRYQLQVQCKPFNRYPRMISLNILVSQFKSCLTLGIVVASWSSSFIARTM